MGSERSEPCQNTTSTTNSNKTTMESIEDRELLLGRLASSFIRTRFEFWEYDDDIDVNRRPQKPLLQDSIFSVIRCTPHKNHKEMALFGSLRLLDRMKKRMPARKFDPKSGPLTLHGIFLGAYIISVKQIDRTMGSETGLEPHVPPDYSTWEQAIGSLFSVKAILELEQSITKILSEGYRGLSGEITLERWSLEKFSDAVEDFYRRDGHFYRYFFPSTA